MTLAHPSLDQMRGELRVGEDFLAKYNRPGPRYTSYLTPEQIEDLFTFTREHFHFDPNSEIGIEVDPRVTSRQHLETLRKLGFNRLSMGIQDFQAEVQQAVHRIQPYEMTRDLLFAAR